MIDSLIRKIKIFVFIFSKKICRDTGFFKDTAMCQDCNELHGYYRFEDGNRIRIFYFLPLRVTWRLEICTYCYATRKQEFTWGRKKIELN